MRLAVSAVLMLFALSVFAAEKLVTASYEVTIDLARCTEGSVTCDVVTYTGVNRKSGKSITLTGRTLHALCADRVTPCRFLGYVFRRGKLSYTVWEHGYLDVKEGRKVLVREKGEWR